ncbi:cobaltochelatase subunit CobN [Rhodocyclus gracilis]|uniref:Cobaltochelatase subunit CobN n=1 Tax=Rhodocyclus tenuis TaxID=1066 RepID=A0A6L5JVR6_RHOTE|nr:cobaltochelatase subunit CobN [Rhodocyclus gracilis]MQY50268.1 cobaltochelatase subunit CobN [Rhodocyclus gracilis]
MPVLRLLATLATLALLLPVSYARGEAVLFVSTSPVPPGKFLRLTDIAAAQGLRLEHRVAERLPSDPDGSLFAGYDAVFFDTPRDHLQAFVRTRLSRALPTLSVPHLWLHESRPSGGGFSSADMTRLQAYYVNGGHQNFENFFRTLAARLRAQPVDGIPPPHVFPKAAIYHPRAPQTVFADPAAYFRWRGIDPTLPAAERPPIIAIALHQTYVASEQTAFIDDLIARIEAAGAIALPYYSSVMEPQAPMLSVAGQRVADALINTQIVLDPEGRRAELAALGIPVIQALSYRKGDEADWRTDAQGLPLADIPFFLAQGEYAGIIDPIIASSTRKSDEQLVAIAEQSAAVVTKALNLVRLQRLAPANKKVAVLFWNYPPGEKNLSASYLNLPRSLVATLAALHAAGYDTPPQEEEQLTRQLQRLLAPYYRDDQLAGLLRDGLADRLPLATYQQWFGQLPPSVQRDITERWGSPEKSSMVISENGQRVFVIPRLLLGKLTITPQSPRGEKLDDREKALYHSPKATPSHAYLAHYLWLRQGFHADALIHFGTHGTQEWLPGKERGLATSDYPLLAVGDVPVIYPYIVDNIGEALQAKRRGRAVIVTHQTPAFIPAGLHETTVKLHDLLHAWLAQDDGAVKQKLAADLLAGVKKERIDRDMGWSDARIATDFRAFVDALHSHLHELAQTAQPLGLHTFGTAPPEMQRIGTVLLMLGRPFSEAAARAAGVRADDLDEVYVSDYSRLADSIPYRLLKGALDGTQPPPSDPTLAALLEQGKRWYADLGAGGELAGLLSALAGEHRPTSYGGDPVKNPDALPTGRNLYGFDPSRVPTPQAWAAGKDAAEALIAAYRAKSGHPPKKLAFSLWSVETMRHQGILEAQALWAMGVEPQWDAGGRLVDVKLVPRAALGRARVDVVLSATGLYRDHFPNVMKLLAKAAELAARADESDNPLLANSRAIAARLEAQGVPGAAAQKAAETRIFSSESGRYGTGLDDATLATDTWKGKADGDRTLAALYLSRMQFGYGSDEADWGSKGIAGASGEAAKINLYAEHLKGTEGAVLSRSSNLYGMLTTDDPFQYLGGIALAVRQLDGKAPELFIANLRGNASEGQGSRVEAADAFLAKELATRNFHPGYIKGLMAEGYAGTLQVLDSVNNFWGWTAVAREVVRDDQWQEFADVYVRDKHHLGLKDWFEKNNPNALAQSIERMLEASRQGYWAADAATVAELKQRYRELAVRHDIVSSNSEFNRYVGVGEGRPLSAAAAASRQSAPAKASKTPATTRAKPDATRAAPQPQAATPATVKGIQLAAVRPTPAEPAPLAAIGLALLLGAFGGGAWRAASTPIRLRSLTRYSGASAHANPD